MSHILQQNKEITFKKLGGGTNYYKCIFTKCLLETLKVKNTVIKNIKSVDDKISKQHH